MFASSSRAFLFCQKQRFPSTVHALMTATTSANQNTVIPCRFFSFKTSPQDNAKPINKKERAKTPEAPKISLLDTNDKILCVATVDEAEKMANARKLRLVKMIDKDIRTTRPVYKLMSETDYIEEDLKLRKQNREERKKTFSYVKGEKLMLISSNITTFDLEMKLHKAEKWLQKKFEVRVLISGDPKNPSTAVQVFNENLRINFGFMKQLGGGGKYIFRLISEARFWYRKLKFEEIYNKFKKTLEEKSRIVQKIFKSGNLKFHILPPKEEDTTDAEKSTSNDKSDAEKSSVV